MFKIEYYNIFSIFVTSGLLLAFGLMFLFVNIPVSPLLDNYRKARNTMAFAYLFFIPVNVMEYLFSDPGRQSIPLFQAITLTIAASQALLFTLSLLALLEIRFPGWRNIFREAVPTLLLIAVVFIVYVFCSGECFKTAFYGIVGIYALLLARYAFLFITSYRLFRFRMDNYFSEDESGRLRWVAFSFYTALAIGVMALLTAVFTSTAVSLLFTLLFDVFYIWFAIRLLNYPYLFQQIIEQAMEDRAQEETIQADNDIKTGRNAFVVLGEKIEQWVAAKGFIEQGITIDVLAAKFITNHKYISTYINTNKKQTFREWINELRIEEAKIILLQNPGITVNEIARHIGFSDKSHFLRQFKKHTNLSPTEWKNR